MQLISHTRTLLSLGDIIAGVLLAFSEVGRGISMVRPASRRKFRYVPAAPGVKREEAKKTEDDAKVSSSSFFSLTMKFY